LVVLLLIVLFVLSSTCLCDLFPYKKQRYHLIDVSQVVDDANCTIQDVNAANRKIYDILCKLTSKTFFKIFKVDLDSECPFWAMKKMCSGKGGCNVCECDEKEIPIAWKQTTIAHVNKDMFSYMPSKPKWEDNDANCWIQSKPDAKLTYVNLLLNPETRTGYSGEDASRVWRAIYNENCFTGKLDDMCMEERVFYRLISGLHMSITMKIVTYYYPINESATPSRYEDFLPNYEMFYKIIAPFPDRIKNLYFLYSFTQRALQKAAPFLSQYKYDTGNATEDRETKELMNQLLSMHEQCAQTFDERLMFRAEGTQALREQMRAHFRNISNIMDCVACEKCKMWAKLEMLGLATALKIVLSDANDTSAIQSLQRNEIIALINSFKQHAQSINDLQMFEEARFRKELAPIISIGVTSAIGILVLVFFIQIGFTSKKESISSRE